MDIFQMPRGARFCVVATAIFVAASFGILFVPTGALATDVNCGTGGGDSAGWTVASGGDFDGDGIADVAIGAPCARVGALAQAGRVVVRAGGTGKHLRTIKGTVAGQKLGGGLSFAGDIDGDGKDDLIVGSPGWTVTNLGPTKASAGKAEVFAKAGGAITTIQGSFGQGNLGEAVAGLGDVNGDSIPDFVVGAGNDRQSAAGDKVGAVYLVSGKTGGILDASYGALVYDQWGAVVSRAGDVDKDGVEDILVSSNAADYDGNGVTEENNGLVRVLSGGDLSRVLVERHGGTQEKLGRSSCMLGDVDGDGTLDFAAGAPGVTVSQASNAGKAAIYSGATGVAIRAFNESAPVAGAAFGTAITNIGSVDNDAMPDIVISAPNVPVGGASQVGRIHLLPGKGGSPLWSVAGTIAGGRYGHSLTTGPDWNGDGYNDVVVGSPGGAFRGRRGSGTVQVLSGLNGSELARFGGHLGMETRLFVVGWDFDDTVALNSLDGWGRRKEVRGQVLWGARLGALSIAVLDDYADASPGVMKLVVGTGHLGDGPSVQFARADRISGTIASAGSLSQPVDAPLEVEFSSSYHGGVNVAAGEFSAEAGDEFAVAQADSQSGDVEVSIYRRIEVDPVGRTNWGRVTSFPLYTSDASALGFLVAAGGATLAVNAVVPGATCSAGESAGIACMIDADCVPPGICSTALESIVAVPLSGLPLVRIFHPSGVLQTEWLAYLPQATSGALVATGVLDAAGSPSIVTMPLTGPLRVRAFSYDGTPYVSSRTGAPVDFVVGGLLNTRLGIAVADVDVDGESEILIAGQDSSGPSRVLAFEVDGTAVANWPRIYPFGPFQSPSFALATTDRFMRQR